MAAANFARTETGQPLSIGLRDLDVSRIAGLDGNDRDGTVLLALSEAQSAKYVPLKASAGTAPFAIMMLMTFAPKIASMIDVLLTNSARRSFSGTIPFALNIAIEGAFMVLLTPIIALTHTIFLVRLFLFRRGGNWTSQMRASHAVPWRLA